jgi:hypothetical protein
VNYGRGEKSFEGEGALSRIRTVKPEFWSSEQVMSVSPLARLLFIGLWNFCDDAGRHPYTPRTLKALIFASDDITTAEVGRMLEELATAGLLEVYSVGAREFLEVTGWHHQRIDHPQKPRYPDRDAPDLPPDGGGRLRAVDSGNGPVRGPAREAVDSANGPPPDEVDSATDTAALPNHSATDPAPIDERSTSVPRPFSPESKRKGSESSSLRYEDSLVPEGSGTREARKGRVELCQAVVRLWNETAAAGGLVAVRDITAARQAAIAARSEDLVKTYEFPDALAGWRKLMGLVRGSPFLRGEVNGFRCDFDFVTRASSFTKIMEGKYEARPALRRR